MPISACRPEGEAGEVFMFHGRRVTSKSNIMRSPYQDRVVDVDATLNSDEMKVSKFLWQTVYDSDTEVLFKGASGQSNRLQLESLGEEYVENNIMDTWAKVRNYMEGYKSNDSPLRLFLPMFVVDKDNFSDLRHDDVRFEVVVHHIESVTSKDSELKSLKKIDLHTDFGRYLYSLGHRKASTMITAKLVFGEYEWQTATVRPYASVFLMRIMETYMGKGMRNWDLRLNTTRGKLQKQLAVLCKKYAATILLSDCNMLKALVRAKIENETGVLSGVPLIKGPIKIKG
ncbi:hypothetical protein Tco_1017093 [Tanacetum coccineum]|uniref:Uncharacterized protein n=1 Tax=Tanacetum coccineum TaxID=301880 RepID=A0ABQ5FRV0_9ASTR